MCISERALEWKNKKEMGSRFWLLLVTRISMFLGRAPVRAILVPVTCYYILVARESRKAISRYLAEALGRKPEFRDIFKLFYSFANTIHDRIYFLTKNYHSFDITLSIDSRLNEFKAKKTGIILIGSHHGSFEILRTIGLTVRSSPVNIMMYRGQHQVIMEILSSISNSNKANILYIGEPDDILKARNCVAKGEVIGILGDRVFYQGKSVQCDFFGKKAEFPTGPMMLASLLKTPVFTFSGLYLGKNRYHIQVDFLTDQVNSGKDRKTRTEEVEGYVQQYAATLEKYCRMAPYNWFNFYDFWRTK